MIFFSNWPSVNSCRGQIGKRRKDSKAILKERKERKIAKSSCFGKRKKQAKLKCW
jgi:hypothetical protein